MTTPRVALLTGQLDMVWALLDYHLPQIDDAACHFVPNPDSWTVRQDEAGRWVADWQVPEPEPVPATSIGWLTWHIGFWWTTTLGHCFGDGAPEREEIAWPGDAAATTAWLRELRDDWRARLQTLTDADLDSTERTATLPWGEGMRLVDIAAWVNFELAKNVSEIGYVLRLHAAAAAPR
ncbi:DinB family protein [Streptomyces hainanensis]|nr:DinB family protein [Streptomyces hainanensis]